MCQFRHDVKKAEGTCTVDMLQVIHDTSPKDWKAAAWILEHCRGFTRTELTPF